MWIRGGRKGGVKEIDLTDFEVKLIGFGWIGGVCIGVPVSVVAR